MSHQELSTEAERAEILAGQEHEARTQHPANWTTQCRGGITNEQREAIVRRAVADRDALLLARKCPECNDTGQRDSGGIHPWGEPVLMPCDCKDAEVGRQWREDSSLEKWFPLTAERLAALEAENAALKREAHTWSKAAETYAASEAKLADALTELVALEDMRLRLRELHEMGHGTDYYDYHRRLPLAWDAARKALGPNVRAKPPANGGSA